MPGFQVSGTDISHDGTPTFLSLLVAVLVVGAGAFTVGHRGARPAPPLAAGLFTGLDVASLGVTVARATGGDGSSALDVLPLLVGPLVFLAPAAAVVVMLDPMLIMDEDEPAGRPDPRIDVGGLQGGLNADDGWGVGTGGGGPGRESRSRRARETRDERHGNGAGCSRRRFRAPTRACVSCRRCARRGPPSSSPSCRRARR